VSAGDFACLTGAGGRSVALSVVEIGPGNTAVATTLSGVPHDRKGATILQSVDSCPRWITLIVMVNRGDV